MKGRACILAALLTTGQALAWDSIGATWPDSELPVVWHLSTDVGDQDIGDVEQAAQAAFTTWSQVSCSRLSFTYGGRVDDARLGEADGRNVVFFLESWPGEGGLVSEPVIYTDQDTLVEVDIAINGQDYPWGALEGDGIRLLDLQGSITHEAGHMVGLWHSSVAGATLNPAMDGHPDARTLEQDDTDGLCALYPQQVEGDGSQGDTCAESSDCREGLICLADGEERYCTSRCDAGESCGQGYTCLSVDESTHVCAREVEGCSCGEGPTPPTTAGVLLLVGALRRRVRKTTRACNPRSPAA